MANLEHPTNREEAYLYGFTDSGYTVPEPVTRKEAYLYKIITQNRTVIDVRTCGAVGDGVTDDSDAFDKAISLGAPVYVPAGTYLITRPLDNSQTVTIYGAGAASKIKLTAGFLSNAVNESYIGFINFITDTVNDITVFPANLNNTIVERCFFGYFKCIISSATVCTIIKDNFIYYLQDCFCRSMIDSEVIGNYINAPMVQNPVTKCFTGVLIHTRIIGNFIDYMTAVVDISNDASIRDVTVTGNTFDVCYCIFHNNIRQVTFTGNVITNLHKPGDWDVSGNTDMDTKPWSVILHESGTFTNSFFGGNSFGDNSLETSFDLYLNVPSQWTYPTRDIIIDEYLTSDYFVFNAYKSGNPRDCQNIMIRPMLKRTVTALPNPALSGHLESFDRDEVIYNNNWYLNMSGQWVQITNNP